MKLSPFLFSLGIFNSLANAYFTMAVYAPYHVGIDGKTVNARDKSFIIGADAPSTYCGLENPSQCPAGESTLINAEMTRLASSVPGGQFIFVAPDGSISYPSAHSSLRPPGSQMGGFFSAEISSDCTETMTILEWQSNNGASGLWACPLAHGTPLSQQAMLKATTSKFTGNGCVVVEGIQITDGGDDYGAWAYN